jgi:hypothetical protein
LSVTFVPAKVSQVTKILAASLLFVVLLVSIASLTPLHAQGQRKALILSSVEKYVPTYYLSDIVYDLKYLGYNVTLLRDSQVTLNVLTTQLNNYDIIFWRTAAYNWAHINYWYVGQMADQATLQQYASDFSQGWADNTNGLLGVSIDFFFHHFPAGSLSNVKLAVLTASLSTFVANVFVAAGVKATIDYYGSFSLTFGTIDQVTLQIVAYLARGKDVYDSVMKTLSPYITGYITPAPLEALTSMPPVWYLGDPTLTIT